MAPPTPVPAPPLNIPSSNMTVKVSVIDNSARLGKVPTNRFFQQDVEGFDFWAVPAYSFLIEHDGRGDKLLFDLGLRKDPENFPPAVKRIIEGWDLTNPENKNVSDVLVDNGVDLADVKDIIWSHRHFDHTGDPSVFPASTNLTVGPGFKERIGEGYPAVEDSTCSSSAWEGRNFIQLDFETDERATQVGQWQAIDWFGDASFYLLRSVGHTVDHISGFARTKLAAQSSTGKDEFMFLGGDVAHHGGEFKPTKFSPIPAEISPDPRAPPYAGGFCPGEYYAEHNDRHGGDDRWKEPFLTSAPALCDDMERAAWSLDVLGEFDAHENVLVIFAHDHTLLDVMEFYPREANDWRDKGWKREGRWRFLADLRVDSRT